MEIASQCGYVVSTLASRQGDPGSNPRAARKSCEVYPAKIQQTKIAVTKI